MTLNKKQQDENKEIKEVNKKAEELLEEIEEQLDEEEKYDDVVEENNQSISKHDYHNRIWDKSDLLKQMQATARQLKGIKLDKKTPTQNQIHAKKLYYDIVKGLYDIQFGKDSIENKKELAKLQAGRQAGNAYIQIVSAGSDDQWKQRAAALNKTNTIEAEEIPPNKEDNNNKD